MFETMFEQHYKERAPDPMFGPGGESVADIIQGTGEIDVGPARDIQVAIDKRTYDHVTAKDGGDQRFGDENYYVEQDVADREYQADWQRFERALKTESRFFNGEAASILKAIFEDLESFSTPATNPLFVKAGPDTNLPVLFRARVFQSEAQLEAALARPDRELGPPPPHFASAGRMNAAGVSVFYGALSPDVAVDEVRPPVGSRVAVARFELLRGVRLLDVGALSSVKVRGSLFDPGFLARLEKAHFFGRLSRRISLPVMPNDEPMDYLITQAISDYLASRKAPNFDGLMYPSAQGKLDHANVVLFHKSARVETAFDDEAKLDVTLYLSTEEGHEPFYHVSEKTPPKRRQPRSSHFPTFEPFLTEPIDDDSRPLSLRLLKEQIQVRHVKGVSYDADMHSVGWHIEKVRRKRKRKLKGILDY